MNNGLNNYGIDWGYSPAQPQAYFGYELNNSFMQPTGLPQYNFGGDVFSLSASPASAMSMYDLSSQGTAGFGDILQYGGLGDTLKTYTNRATGWLGDQWGDMANSTFGKQIGEMPMMDKLKGIAGIIGAVGGVMQGRNQMKLMERSLNQQRDQWNKSWGASTKQYNSEIEDRQRARVASNPNAYQSVDSYMNNNRIS